MPTVSEVRKAARIWLTCGRCLGAGHIERPDGDGELKECPLCNGNSGRWDSEPEARDAEHS